jgi:hypothetical protein
MLNLSPENKIHFKGKRTWLEIQNVKITMDKTMKLLKNCGMS